MAWKTRLFMGLMLSLMLLAIAGPAMADDNNRQERREDRQEFREDFFFFDHDIDFDDCCDDDFDNEVVFVSDFDFDHEFFVSDFGFFTPFVLGIEEIDIDCDEIDDDLDGLFDEGADCEVELEFFDFDLD